MVFEKEFKFTFIHFCFGGPLYEMGYKYKYRLQQLYKPIDAFTICLLRILTYWHRGKLQKLIQANFRDQWTSFSTLVFVQISTIE